jgi:hypothetical protein
MALAGFCNLVLSLTIKGMNEVRDYLILLEKLVVIANPMVLA